MKVLFSNATQPRSRFRFDFPNQPFDLLNLETVDFAGLFVFHKLFNVTFQLLRFFWSNIKLPIELGHKITKTDRIVIKNSDVPRGLVGDMNLMPLINQPNQRSPHRNYVIIGMGRKDQNPLRKNVIVGTRMIAGLFQFVRLSSRPTSNRRVQMSKDFDIDFVSRTVVNQEFLQTLFVVVLVGQTQNRLTQLPREPNDRFALNRFVPLDLVDQPRAVKTSK